MPLEEFYSTLGVNLAKQIKGGVNNIHHYLKRIPRNLQSMVMKQTTPVKSKES